MGRDKNLDIRRNDEGICRGSFSSAQVLKEIGERLVKPHADDGSPAISGLSTGFRSLDRLTDGLHPGELVVVAQRPCMGAERFVRQIMLHIAEKNQVPVVYFSTEKSRAFVLREMVADIAQISPFYYRDQYGLLDEELQAVTSAAERLSEAPIIMNDASANPKDIRGDVELLCKSGYRPGLIVVDKLPRRLETSSEIGRLLGNVSYEIFRIARDFHIPVIVLADVTRKIERRECKRPRLADIANADGIVWYADTVLSLYREELYDPYTAKKNWTEFTILKSFYGDIGWFDLFQERTWGTFVEHHTGSIEVRD